MEEDIKILECENVGDLASIGLIDLLNEENNYDLNKLKKQALENLIKGYRELEGNKELKTIKGFEENIEVSKFGEWVGKNYIDYKFEYENYQRILADYIPKSKIKEYIEKNIKYHQKNILDIENVTLLKEKTLKEQTEIEFNKYALAIYSRMLSDFMEDK